jgi:hypothetical protein
MSVISLPHDARDRQARSEEELGQFGIRTPATLPPVVSEIDVVLRPAPEVARRAMALFVVALRAESLMSRDIPVEELKDRPLALRALTPKERAFLNDAAPDQQQITNFVWRYEALWMLAWAIGLVEELCYPSETCDVGILSRILLASNEEALLKKAKLLPTETLLDALDLHFRLHWLVRQRQNGKAPDGEMGGNDLNPGVVLERHHALNWLVQHGGTEWDDVQTPT